MLYKVNFKLKTEDGKSYKEFIYVLTENQTAAATAAQPFIDSFYKEAKAKIELTSVTHIPEGTIITCPMSLEMIPESAKAEDPLMFDKPSVLIS